MKVCVQRVDEGLNRSIESETDVVKNVAGKDFVEKPLAVVFKAPGEHIVRPGQSVVFHS
jgi:hypothetical protein